MLSLQLSSSLVLAQPSSEPTNAATNKAVTVKSVAEGASPIAVDARLDEAAWADALVIDEFWEWFPGQNAEPPVRTEVLLTYDAANLYIGARASDPDPSAIRAHLMDRDDINSLIKDDYILVMIDPFNDQRRAFQFRINPLGVQAEALNSFVDFREDWSWDLIWSSAGRITEDGYVVELRIPLSQLPFPAGQGAQTWRFNFGRSYPRDQRHRMQSTPRQYDNACAACEYLVVEGFEALKPGLSIELDPTLTARRTDTRTPFPDGKIESGDEDYELGLSGHWSVTPSMRLSFAVNPDFSQVEADAAQLAVNERFALFFPEQRPFFLEGVDVFSTPIQAVFTRTVVDPDWGLKLTGKEGKNSIGVFVTQDDFNSVLLPGPQGSGFASSADGLLDNEVTTSVMRYRRDFGQNHSVGVLYTGRDGEDYKNDVAGVDLTLQLGRAHRLTIQGLESETQYPRALREALGLGSEDLSGSAISAGYNYNTRNIFAGGGYNRFDEDFRADTGFISRVGVERAFGNFNYTWWHEPGGFLVNSSLGLNASQTDDLSGDVLDRKLGLSGNFRGPLQSLLFAQTWNIDKRNGQTLFEDLRGAEVFMEMQPNGSLEFSLYVAYEDEVDFTNNRRADLLQLSPNLTARLGRHMTASLSHVHRSFALSGNTYLEADLTELRAFYHFNTRSFIRAILQRREQINDKAFFVRDVQAETEDLFSQLLFSYKLNAQTVLFVGYSDNRDAGEAFELTQRDRTFFVKLGYAWLPKFR